MLKEWWAEFEKKWGGQGKAKNKMRSVLVIGLVGIGILLASSFFEHKGTHLSHSTPTPQSTSSTDSAAPKVSANEKIEVYEKEYEQELQEALSHVVGVDDVSVVVNLDSTEEDVVQMDEHQSEQVTTETDTRGGNRSIRQDNNDRKPAFYRSEQGEQPLVVKRLKPKVRGVLVVARGVENLQVKEIVIQAVQRILDVPLHRISVLPKG
jgi:stage III sporulation protein AG